MSGTLSCPSVSTTSPVDMPFVALMAPCADEPTTFMCHRITLDIPNSSEQIDVELWDTAGEHAALCDGHL